MRKSLPDKTRGVDTGHMEGLFVALGIVGGAMIVAFAYLIIK
jgi:hypothetical protein